MRRALRSLFAVAVPPFVVATTAAQDFGAGREVAFGLVRTATGTPWGGARVVLVGRVHPDWGDVGPVDRVEVDADEQGRFRAGVLPELGYAAWAYEQLEGGARQRVSDAIGGVVPRRPVFLTGSRFLQARRHLRLDLGEGVDVPLRVEVESAAPVGYLQELAVAADGTFPMPVLAPGPFEVRVYDRNGVQLVEHVERGWESWLAREFVVAVPSRKPTRVSVRDAETGGGAGGARICVAQRGELVPIGEVDADGCATLALPATGSFVVLADGYAPSPLDPGEESPAPGGAPWPTLREDFVAERHARIGRGSRLEGRFVVGDGVPLVDAWLRTDEHGLYFHDERTRSLSHFVRVSRLDAGGRFLRAPVLLEFAPEMSLVLGAGAIAQLPAGWRSGLVPVVPSPLAQQRIREGTDLDVGQIDLLEALPIRFRVRSSGGVPVLDAIVEVVPIPPSFGKLAEGPKASVDRRGEVLFLLPRGREYLLLVLQRGGIVDARVVSTVAGPALAEPFGVDIRIPEPTTVVGRVVDGDGKPTDRGRVRWSWQGAGAAAEPEVREPGAAPVGLASVLPEAIASSLARRFLPETVPLEEDGQFRFEVPGIRGVVVVSAGRDRVEVPVSPGVPVEPLLLRIER
ncbi:MAG: hypothetical protein O2865_08935 [Planctomycetota bacterium]|nr:hypothetical protein [Planctomycetota bacterium]